MEDKVFLATAKTEESLTDEQLSAVVEHGWQMLPNPAEESAAIYLLRPVRNEDEATGQFAELIRDDRLSGLLGIVSRPYIENPLQAPTSPQGAFLEGGDLPRKPGSPSGDAEKTPEPTDGAAGKSAKPQEEPVKPGAPPADAFPTIPDYLWSSLKPASQDELAKKLVDYVINRSDTAAYSSSFDDAALFAHLTEEERSGLAKQILEQKHGMTGEQLRRQVLVNNFQEQRVKLMEKAVDTAQEVNVHLTRWRELSNHVGGLLRASSIVAGVLVLLLFGLVLVGRISGWEMAVLAFVFALMAVSPATLLLIGRPLKGLDEWGPGKQEAKAEHAATEEPAKDKGKPEAKAAK